MNIFNEFKDILAQALAKEFSDLPSEFLEKIQVETPKDSSHGDLSSNVAMMLAKPLQMNPRQVAEKLLGVLSQHEYVEEASIAGPGFLNWFVTKNYWIEKLGMLLQEGSEFGQQDLGHGEKVNVEYVSANPTGPLHLAHARGAVFGDVLSSLLNFMGYDVTKEYYINDAGRQVEYLAKSVYWRYQELFEPHSEEMPGEYYPGEYLVPIAEKIKVMDGDKWLGQELGNWFDYFKSFAIEEMMQLIREDLELLSIKHDVFTSEAELVHQGKVNQLLDVLEERGLIYEGVLEPPKGKKPDDWEPTKQTLFRSTAHGDDVDRALKKSDGSWTYFANDIANHYEKFVRGYTQVINVWGADHAGYIKRCEVAFDTLTESKGDFDVKVCQMVRLLKDGELMRMSKRAGKFLTLKDLLDEVGKDVIRFIMLTRRNDQHLDFDIDQVTEQSKDNPVFYVQYAYARCCSVERNIQSVFPNLDVNIPDIINALKQKGCDQEEFELIKKLLSWPKILQSAAHFHEPHRIAFYLYELASEFHALWNKGKDKAILRFIHEEDETLTLSRLSIVYAVRYVIQRGLILFGVEPMQKM